jgi:hypothetical protein
VLPLEPEERLLLLVGQFLDVGFVSARNEAQHLFLASSLGKKLHTNRSSLGWKTYFALFTMVVLLDFLVVAHLAMSHQLLHRNLGF